MVISRKRLLPWTAPILLLVLAGCGGSDIKKVSGTLTYKGQPVPDAYVTFTPDNGRPSWGETDGQGRFTLHYDKTQDGAIAGKHKVSVRPKPTASTEPGMAPKLSADTAAFYDKYGARSTVEVTIDKNDSNLKLDWD